MEWVIGGGVLLWACWHWFLRRWFRSSGVGHVIGGTGDALARKARSAAIPEEDLYAQVYEEVSSDQIQKGIWARAWSEAEGDEQRAKARYLKLRVEQLKRAGAPKAGSAPSNTSIPDQHKVSIECPRCGGEFSLPASRDVVATCPHCKAKLRAITTKPTRVEVIGPHADQQFGRIGRVSCAAYFAGFMVVSIIAFTVLREMGMDGQGPSTKWLIGITVFLCYCQSTIFAARLHDLGWSGWWALLGLVPFMNLLMFFIFIVIEGDEGPNRFGAPSIGLLIEKAS